jgi:hypothetical protein
MANIYKYVQLIISKLLTRIFILFDLLGVIFYLITRNVPKVPWFATVAIFGLILLSSCYSVWKDEVIKNKKLKAELQKIKETIPDYKIEVIAIEKYTVEKLIHKYSSEIQGLVDKKEHKRAVDNGEVQEIFNFARQMQQIANAMKTANQLLGVETDDEKIERLTNHLNELRIFEDVLKHLYKIDILIEATRADSNVEISMTSDGVALFRIDDDTISTYQPRLTRPTSRLVDSPAYAYFDRSMHLPIDMLPNVMKSDSDLDLWHKNSLSTHIKWINADHRESVFDEAVFVQFNGERLKMKTFINSEKIIKTKNISIEVDLSHIVPTQLGER